MPYFWALTSTIILDASLIGNDFVTYSFAIVIRSVIITLLQIIINTWQKNKGKYSFIAFALIAAAILEFLKKFFRSKFQHERCFGRKREICSIVCRFYLFSCYRFSQYIPSLLGTFQIPCHKPNLYAELLLCNQQHRQFTKACKIFFTLYSALVKPTFSFVTILYLLHCVNYRNNMKRWNKIK